MRTESDIKNIRFTLLGRLQIDLERVEDDPEWAPFAVKVASGEITLDEALKRYLMKYFSREEFPHDIPVTNGPADLMGLNLEVINASNSGN